MPPRRFPLAAFALAAALAAAGCGGNADNQVHGKTLTVYVSVPLHGQSAVHGRAIVNGAKLALADAGGKVGDLDIQAIYLDDTAGTPARWSPAVTADNARRASEDTKSIAYIGDFDSGATRFSLPITNQAETLQVSPASTAVDLTRPAGVPGAEGPDRLRPSGIQTFGRIVPADDVQARAAALWAKQLGAKRVAVVQDASEFGAVLASALRREAGRLGIETAAPGRSADAIYYAGTPPGAGKALAGLPAGPVIASDALLDPSFLRQAGAVQGRLRITSAATDPAHLPPAGRRFASSYRRTYGEVPDPYAAYGYEAMAVVLDSIRRAGGGGDNRPDVIDAFLHTRDRYSVIGTYSITPHGDTTLDTIAGDRVLNGKPVFDRLLHAPR